MGVMATTSSKVAKATTRSLGRVVTITSTPVGATIPLTLELVQTSLMAKVATTSLLVARAMIVSMAAQEMMSSVVEMEVIV